MAERQAEESVSRRWADVERLANDLVEHRPASAAASASSSTVSTTALRVGLRVSMRSRQAVTVARAGFWGTDRGR
jgi:hypothetical protein